MHTDIHIGKGFRVTTRLLSPRLTLQVSSLRLCSAPAHPLLLDLHRRCRCETQGEWMVFALTKPLDSRAKDGVISAEMSMQTSSICPTSICLFRMGGSDGTRCPRRCLQVRHQILIWKMHWSEAPSKMEEQKCWKETH